MNWSDRIRADFAASYGSLKLPQVEEWFDIYFSRFFGYYLAVASRRIGLAPNQVSLLSLAIGMIAGILFYCQDQFWVIVGACLLITFAGLLDSADGQLARMTGTASDLGRKIDVIIDTFVFVAAYFGGGFYFWLSGQYTFLEISALGVLAGYLHSVKSAVYEFYKTEYLYYHFKTRDYRIPYLSEVKETAYRGGFWRETLFILEKDYIGKQAFYVGRSRETRLLFESWSQADQGDRFKNIYEKHSLKILTIWALVGGTNVHRTALMAFALFGRMDLYFIFSIVTFLPMLMLNLVQNQIDKRIIHESQVLLASQ